MDFHNHKIFPFYNNYSGYNDEEFTECIKYNLMYMECMIPTKVSWTITSQLLSLLDKKNSLFIAFFYKSFKNYLVCNTFIENLVDNKYTVKPNSHTPTCTFTQTHTPTCTYTHTHLYIHILDMCVYIMEFYRTIDNRLKD